MSEGGMCATSRAIFNFMFLLLAIYLCPCGPGTWGAGQLNDWPFSVFEGNQAAGEHQGEHPRVF